jgi:hypothetical protein
MYYGFKSFTTQCQVKITKFKTIPSFLFLEVKLRLVKIFPIFGEAFPKRFNGTRRGQKNPKKIRFLVIK